MCQFTFTKLPDDDAGTLAVEPCAPQSCANPCEVVVLCVTRTIPIRHSKPGRLPSRALSAHCEGWQSFHLLGHASTASAVRCVALVPAKQTRCNAIVIEKATIPTLLNASLKSQRIYYSFPSVCCQAWYCHAVRLLHCTIAHPNYIRMDADGIKCSQTTNLRHFTKPSIATYMT